MEQIKVRFTTNLDLISADKHQWPEQMPFLPRVGDLVRSPYVHPGRTALVKVSKGDEGFEYVERFMGNGFQLELAVVRVTLVADNKERWTVGRFDHAEVELHLPGGRWSSLKDFYENWYEKITGSKFI